jgi:2-dehydro-3-deoxygluconokinase
MNILTFGEALLHIKPKRDLLFRQSLPGTLRAGFGGAEANVAVSLSILGNNAFFMTSLPKNKIVDSLLASLKSAGVNTDYINFTKYGRLGIYFTEPGTNQRPSEVIYDRAYSAISLAKTDEYDFDKALEGIDWVHVTGITPALSENAYKSCLALVTKAKKKKITISCDLNFRKKLWNWEPRVKQTDLAKECMSKLLPFINLLIANEEDAENVLGIQAKESDAKSGRINISGYEEVAKKIVKTFPNIKKVAFTLRESISASHNNWGGMLFDAKVNKSYFAPLDNEKKYAPYEIRNIIDRVGAGDAFAAGLIHALNSRDYSAPEKAISFAVAASCLKHSIQGDFNYSTLKQIESLLKGNSTGRIQR